MNATADLPKIPLPQPEVPVFERGLWNRAWFMLLLCLVFVGLDWELIPLQVFPVVFVFPLMLVAWNRPLWLSTLCAVLLSLTRVLHQVAFTSSPIVVNEMADAFICFFVLELLALMTTMLGRQSRQLRQRVRALEGLLPLCSFCKSIRDDQQNWVRLEEYITQHSEAVFSHGLCPDCARKHYGEFYPPKK